jgi:thioredoxin-dependent peroxiredoxin
LKLGKPSKLGGRLTLGSRSRSSPDDTGRLSGGGRLLSPPLSPTRHDYAPDVVSEGEPAPDFTATTDTGERVSLSDFRGKPVVLYFYPKDDTPGCTAQACGIRDAYAEFERAGAVVLGVSPDSTAEHVKFKEKYDLPFTLLADPEHEVAERYGTWGEKRYQDRTYWGVSRTTFLVAADGTVAKVMHDVKPDTHADDVLSALAST